MTTESKGEALDLSKLEADIFTVAKLLDSQPMVTIMEKCAFERIVMQLTALARAGLAAPTGQKAEPVAEVIEDVVPGTGITARDVKFIGSAARPGDKLYLAAPAATQKEGASEQDAARYRFLREQRGIQGDLPTDGDVWVVQMHQPRGTIPELRCAGFGEKLDRAIDAAMSAAQAQPKDTTDTKEKAHG